MNRTTTASPLRMIAVLAVVAACTALLPSAIAVGAEATTKYQPESFSQYQQQLAAGQIKAVTINKRLRSLRVTLKDGSRVLAKYKPHEEKQVASALRAKGITPKVLAPGQAAKEVVKKPVKHKLRYIAGGIVIVVALVVGAVLYVDRKRKRGRE